MNLYFVLNKTIDKYVRVSHKAMHMYLSSLDCNIWKSSLYGGNIIGFFDKEDFVEYFERPLAFIVEVAKDV